MRILDLFAGTGSATKAFEDAGHEVIKVELDEYFEAHERDVMALNVNALTAKYGKFDFIWASPPCTTFSIASVGHYWKNGKPSEAALHGMELVKRTIRLVEELEPTYGWLIENPRGMLRKQDFMKGLPRTTISYCQYGDFRMKPTDLWGYVPNWTPRPMCKPRSSCHVAAPAGSTTGTQGMSNKKKKSMIPYELGAEILEALTNGK